MNTSTNTLEYGELDFSLTFETIVVVDILDFKNISYK
jgi:hypothetical protein